MRAVIAIDSFKGSVTSAQAGAAAATGVRQAFPDAHIVVLPVADGGEGTLDALAHSIDGQFMQATVADVTGQPRDARFLLSGDGELAVLETAETVGMWQVEPVDSSTPERTSSYGCGQLIRAAITRGARRILVTLGGSGCTDGGAGLLVALGATLWNADGAEIIYQPGQNPLLQGPVRLELPQLDGVELVGLTDVDSPLTGSHGAARLFGPQKGATAEQVDALEAAMESWQSALPEGMGDTAGAGAAGGIGVAILALGGSLESGFAAVAREANLERHFVGADIVVTGEGRLDEQSALGKVPFGVARLARGHRVPFIAAVAGSVPDKPGPEFSELFTVISGIHSRMRPLAEAMDPAVALPELTRTVCEIVASVRQQ